MAFKKGKSTLVTDQGIFCCLQLLRMRSENPALLLVEWNTCLQLTAILGITEALGCIIYPLDNFVDTLCPNTPVCSNTNRNQTASESAAQQPQLWPFLSNGTSIARSNSSRRSVLGWLKFAASRADTNARDQQLTLDVVDKQRSKNSEAASNLLRFQSRIGTSIPSSNIINDGSGKYASSRMDGTSAVQRRNQSSVHASKGRTDISNSNVSTNNSASLTAGSRLVRNTQANKHARQPYLGSKTASIPQESAEFGHAQSAHARALLGSPSPADPTISTPSPSNLNSTGTSSPPSLSPTSAWLQSVTNNTGNYVTSTISLTDNSLNADGLVAQGTMSGVTVASSGGSSSTPNVSTVDTFNGDASYVTSMQDLPYTLFVAGVLMTALVLAHAGESRFSVACRDVHLKCQREATCSWLLYCNTCPYIYI